MEEKKFFKEDLNDFISFAKIKANPTVSIIDDVSDEEFEKIIEWAGRLHLVMFKVKNSRKIAFIYDSSVVKKIARNLNKKVQIMYQDFSRRPKGSITIAALSGFKYCGWDILRDNGFKVLAYDEQGNEIPEFIDTNVEDEGCRGLLSFGFRNFTGGVRIGGGGGSGESNILYLSKKYFALDGVYNEKRNCYYPKKLTNSEIADYNRIEKGFKKWGFREIKDRWFTR
ncbi:MAG: hypothetical protein LBL91_01115 [Lachnospiraceae bacterium]|nr:hypothetical protein [Lachnospiraceae bacterium]